MTGRAERALAWATGTLFAFGVAAFVGLWIIGPAVRAVASAVAIQSLN